MPIYRDAEGGEYYALAWDLEETSFPPFDGPGSWSGRPVRRLLKDEPNHFRFAGLLTVAIVAMVALAGPRLLWQAGGQARAYMFMAALPLFFMLNGIIPTAAIPWRTEPAKVDRALILVRPQPFWAAAEMIARGTVFAALGICVALLPNLVAALDDGTRAVGFSPGVRLTVWGVGGVLALGGIGIVALEVVRLRGSRT